LVDVISIEHVLRASDTAYSRTATFHAHVLRAYLYALRAAAITACVRLAAATHRCARCVFCIALPRAIFERHARTRLPARRCLLLRCATAPRRCLVCLLFTRFAAHAPHIARRLSRTPSPRAHNGGENVLKNGVAVAYHHCAIARLAVRAFCLGSRYQNGRMADHKRAAARSCAGACHRVGRCVRNAVGTLVSPPDPSAVCGLPVRSQAMTTITDDDVGWVPW